MRHLLDGVKLSGGSWNTVQTLAFLLEVGGKGILFVLSAVFWGAMLVFSLLRRGGQMFMFDWKSLYTRILWGALLPWLEAEPWVNDSRRRVTADDNYNINIWEWERHPGKKVKAVCSQEQLGGGCPLWDSQADKQKGEQIAHHTAELSWEDPAYQRSYLDRSAKIDKLFMLNLDKNDCH